MSADTRPVRRLYRVTRADRHGLAFVLASDMYEAIESVRLRSRFPDSDGMCADVHVGGMWAPAPEVEQ